MQIVNQSQDNPTPVINEPSSSLGTSFCMNSFCLCIACSNSVLNELLWVTAAHKKATPMEQGSPLPMSPCTKDEGRKEGRKHAV